MTVRTLSRWVDRLLKGLVTMECPRMEILRRDFEPPVFVGSGRIVINKNTHMHFVMHGTPGDGSDALKKIVAAQNNPYDHQHQFRMNAVDYDGTEWSGGWTTLRTGEIVGGIWQLWGDIQALYTGASGFGVSERNGVELVYDSPLRFPIPANMVKTVYRDDQQVFSSRSAGVKVLDVLDTKIEFFKSVGHEHVWAVADASHALPHPHLENWLSEPLNLLLGEVVSPRLIARNKGDGTAAISLHPSSTYSTSSLVACILREDPLGAGERFWNLYRNILTLVATTRDAAGHRNFEAHPLTRYYWEIIQATKGSNWVLCMTLASTVEGIVKMMFSQDERKSDWPESDVLGLRKVVDGWQGNNDLRSRVLNYLDSFKMKGVAGTLKSLIGAGCITTEQVDAWVRIRNSSMHGEMAMPWSDEGQDARIGNLIELTHRLSEDYIKRELEKRAAGPH